MGASRSGPGWVLELPDWCVCQSPCVRLSSVVNVVIACVNGTFSFDLLRPYLGRLFGLLTRKLSLDNVCWTREECA